MLIVAHCVLLHLAIATAPPAVEWQRLFVNLRPSLASNSILVAPHTSPRVSWGFAVEQSCDQAAFHVQVFDSSKLIIDTTSYSAQQFWVIAADKLAPAMRYTWRVSVDVRAKGKNETVSSGWSATHVFLTGPVWSLGTSPIWSHPDASGGLSRFALLRSQFAQPPSPSPRRVVSALAFITANAPMNVMGDKRAPPKILGAYKLWVNGVLVGVGPGRPICSPVQLRDAVPCAQFNGSRPPQQMYDGYDLTHIVGNETALDVFVVGYGVNQTARIPRAPSGSLGPKVQAEIHLLLSDGTKRVIATKAKTWDSMSGDEVYSPGLENSGCSWYVELHTIVYLPLYLRESCSQFDSLPLTSLTARYDYPQEDFNGTAAPPNTPITPLSAALPPVASPRWASAAAQAPFSAPLTAKWTSPIAIKTLAAASVAVEQINASSYFFDLGRNVQGGVVVTLRVPSAVAAAARRAAAGSSAVVVGRVRVAEELVKRRDPSAQRRIMWPPRTGVHPEVRWTFSATTTAPQTIQLHEYVEYRYGEIVFSVRGILKDDFDVSAWVISLPFDDRSFATMESSDTTLDRVWELCRYTIEASS